MPDNAPATLERLRYLRGELLKERSRALEDYERYAHPKEDVSGAGMLLYGELFEEYRDLLGQIAAARGLRAPGRRSIRSLGRKRRATFEELEALAMKIGL